MSELPLILNQDLCLLENFKVLRNRKVFQSCYILFYRSKKFQFVGLSPEEDLKIVDSQTAERVLIKKLKVHQPTFLPLSLKS